MRRFRASVCTPAWRSGPRIESELNGCAGTFRDLRSPENGCSNSPMGGSRIDFVTRSVLEGRDGTTHVVFEPTELIEKLAVLVPWPRSNALRYHGVFAPGSKWREAVIRDRSYSPTPTAPDPATPLQGAGSLFRPRYLPWAKLIARVFESEVLVCPACGGEAKVIAAALP